MLFDGLVILAIVGLYFAERWWLRRRSRKAADMTLTQEEKEQRFDEIRRQRSEEIKALRKGKR